MAQTAAFVVQVAGPVAGMAGGVAALFRPEAGPCFFLRLVLFARGRYERPLSVARCILRCRVVRLEADRLVGPVVALAEQNAIGLVRAVVASSHTCKEAFRGIAAEGQTEAQ